MQVRLLKNIGTRDKHLPQLMAGDVFVASTEDDERTCAFLVKRGLAEEIKSVAKSATIKAVPPKSKPNLKADYEGRNLGDFNDG